MRIESVDKKGSKAGDAREKLLPETLLKITGVRQPRMGEMAHEAILLAFVTQAQRERT